MDFETPTVERPNEIIPPNLDHNSIQPGLRIENYMFSSDPECHRYSQTDGEARRGGAALCWPAKSKHSIVNDKKLFVSISGKERTGLFGHDNKTPNTGFPLSVGMDFETPTVERPNEIIPPNLDHNSIQPGLGMENYMFSSDPECHRYSQTDGEARRGGAALCWPAVIMILLK
ncbi:hypothetical protein J6590_032788 [Homalodisca vitripennis]|nr:hypothetical protein J6590_032788 [Homalodisca vitripennis]